MAINLWPVDAVTGAPSYSGRTLRQMMSVPMMTANNARPLAVRTGVMLSNAGGATAFCSLSGTTYTINSHSGVVDAESSAIAGGYFYSIDAAATGTIGAVPAVGNYRADLISLQISDPAESDGTSTPGAAIVYTQGVANITSPGTLPSAPARSISLARVDIPYSGGGSPTITWIAPLTAAAGGILPAIGGTGRSVLPTATTVPVGTFAWSGLSSSNLELYYNANDGSAWVPVTQRGVNSYTILSGTASVTGTASFPNGYGTMTPTVVAVSTSTQTHAIAITSSFSTGYNFRAFRTAGTNAGSNEAGTFSWIATI